MMLGRMTSPKTPRSVHALDELIDEVLPVAPVAAPLFAEAVALVLEATLRGGKLEGPEEVGSLLEVRANGEDLVDQVFHAENPKLTKVLRDDLVVRERDALLVDLAEAALVHQLLDRLERGE